jgi:hypothetical protein
MLQVTIKQRIEHAVAAHGANAVAKALGIPRGTLGSYLIGVARRGTIVLVETNAPNLTRLDEAA